MGYLSALFAKASEIERLKDANNFLESCLAREIDRNKLLEKSIVSERNSKDKFMALMADRLSIQAKLPSGFAKSIEPEKKKPDEYLLSDDDEAKVDEIARLQLEGELARGYDPPDDPDKILKQYKSVIRQNLSAYLPT